MAKESSRSFGQYSGVDRQNQLQKLPSATDRLSDPVATQAMRDTAPSALGLAERGATPSGRSFYDPARQAERWVRGTGSQDQTQAAETAQRFNDAADPIAAARRMAFGSKGRGVGQVAGPSAPVIPPTVADPGAAPTPVQAPSIFNQSMNNPAMAQSNALIGRALSRSGLNAQRAPFRSGASTVLGPQTFF